MIPEISPLFIACRAFAATRHDTVMRLWSSRLEASSARVRASAFHFHR
jgi:hypothetical protein